LEIEHDLAAYTAVRAIMGDMLMRAEFRKVWNEMPVEFQSDMLAEWERLISTVYMDIEETYYVEGEVKPPLQFVQKMHGEDAS
jgi:hypothetical protein